MTASSPTRPPSATGSSPTTGVRGAVAALSPTRPAARRFARSAVLGLNARPGERAASSAPHADPRGRFSGVSYAVDGVRAGSALLCNHDRWADAQALDIESLTLKPLGRPPAHEEHVHGWFVRRQGRIHALFRWKDRLSYLYGRKVWDIDDSRVRRRSIGPLRSLTFDSGAGEVKPCRWLDWELARRWFIPKFLDVARDEDDSEDFDWSLFVEAVLSTNRRDRIG